MTRLGAEPKPPWRVAPPEVTAQTEHLIGAPVHHPAYIVTDASGYTVRHARAAMIRLAEPADTHAVTACVMLAYAHYVDRIGRQPGPMTSNYAELIGRGVVHVLVQSDDIAGVLVLQREDPTLWVENVAVHPMHQHKGLGRQLLAFAEHHAQAAGMSELRLYTHELMVENIALYQRLGYREVERREEFGFRRVFMCKPILKIREFQPGDGDGYLKSG